MLDKITAFIDSILIHALLITILVLSIQRVNPEVVPPVDEVIQVVALDEGQVRDAIKLVKQEQRQFEVQQAKQRELEKIANEQKLREEPPKEKIEPPKPKVEDKQKRIKERKALEQKQLEEANRKAQEKAEKERQRLETAKRKAKQLDEERLAKEAEKKPRKKVEEKPKEREQLAKREKAEEKKRQAREEQKRQAAEKRKEQQPSAKQEEKREATTQRHAEAKRKAAAEAAEKRKAAAEAAEKRKAAAAAEDQRKKEAGETAQQKRAQDNKARIGPVKAQIMSRIKSRWRQPPGTNLSCVVFVSILPSGALIPRLSKSSGNGAFDQSALAAVRSASPFPIPKDLLGFFRGEGVSVTFRSH